MSFLNLFGQRLAALEEVNQPIAKEQLDVLRHQVEAEAPDPSPQSEFNYAWGLLKLKAVAQQKEGLRIFTRLYRDVAAMRRETLYYLALGSYKVGEYSDARRYAAQLLEKEPDNAQFKAVKEAIDDKITQDGLIGLGVAGGLLAVGVTLVGALTRRRR